MKRISFTDGAPLGPDDIAIHFISDCKKLSEDYDLLTFAFIIYNNTNPEIVKLLRDDDYWLALDITSGDRLMVMELCDKSNENHSGNNLESKIIDNYKPRIESSKAQVNYTEFMNALFGESFVPIYPSIIFFQIFNNTIHEYKVITLPEKVKGESFTYLKKLFISIDSVLKYVKKENYKNKIEIFQLVEQELKNSKLKYYIAKGPKLLTELLSVISLWLELNK